MYNNKLNTIIFICTLLTLTAGNIFIYVTTDFIEIGNFLYLGTLKYVF